jgi:hypothetical protein
LVCAFPVGRQGPQALAEVLGRESASPSPSLVSASPSPAPTPFGSPSPPPSATEQAPLGPAGGMGHGGRERGLCAPATFRWEFGKWLAAPVSWQLCMCRIFSWCGRPGGLRRVPARGPSCMPPAWLVAGAGWGLAGGGGAVRCRAGSNPVLSAGPPVLLSRASLSGVGWGWEWDGASAVADPPIPLPVWPPDSDLGLIALALGMECGSAGGTVHRHR